MNQCVEILRRLSCGGYGDVYLGRLLPGGTEVVVKYLRDYHLPHCRKAFERELQILSRRLPGLIPVLCADLTAQPPYYVMPYLKAGTLTQYAGRLTEQQLHAVAMDLARTLAGLHSVFEADGDVKPDNVLVTNDGHLQVADPLGNGGLLTMLFSENCGGTPGYCAPEIRAGGSISRASLDSHATFHLTANVIGRCVSQASAAQSVSL
jgi:eukaryotic-like serine/threonine-protein kinase